MKIIDTSQASPKEMSGWEREQTYNGLDCCITYELLEVLQPQLNNVTNSIYQFSKALQGPVLAMRLRGVLVDKERRAEVLEEYHWRLSKLEQDLEKIVREGLGVVGFNWASPKQLHEVFYDKLGLPPVRKRGSITVDREALEKLGQDYTSARCITSYLTPMRDIAKKMAVLRTEIDTDNRIRTSYNIGGTNTGRLSSSLSEFGTGGNLQNIEELLRSVLVADPGMKMAYFDAQQGESRVVGAIEYNLFGDSRYLDACESSDLHTTVAKLVWPGLAWTGDPELDKKLAEKPYYRHYSRRFMCKKIGHGTNYKGQPHTLATQAQVELDLIEEFQPKYFTAFPAHLKWHAWVQNEILTRGSLVSLTGRYRQFWGRRNDPEVLREAIAYDPQGSLADIVNNGMLQVWRGSEAQLLMQVHDAIVVQYREEVEDEVIPKILKLLAYPIPIRDREFVIPYDVKTGWNFGVFCCGNKSECKDCNKQANPHGLKEYRTTDKRSRPEKLSILDRPFRGGYKWNRGA